MLHRRRWDTANYQTENSDAELLDLYLDCEMYTSLYLPTTRHPDPPQLGFDRPL
jgi:hypothetical protein